MERADVRGGEAMVRSVPVERRLLGQLQRLRLGLVHVAHPRYTEQIAQHAAVRARFEFGLGTRGFVLSAHAQPPV